MNINLLAPINTVSYGIVSLNIALALKKLGYNLALWPIHQVEAPPTHHDTIREWLGNQKNFHGFAPSLRIWHQFNLAEHVGTGIHAAFPIFELTEFLPNEIHHLDYQDVIFVASDWAKKIVVDAIRRPEDVCVAPFGVDTSIFYPTRPNVGGATRFCSIGKWEYRKGHDFLLSAFNKAFEPSNNVQLDMLCHNLVAPNAERYNQQWERSYMLSKMGQAGKIRLLPRQNSQEDVANIMREADCGVFPSRAEGWGMESSEMLAMGKEVILTNYSGHTQYCSPANSLLIEVEKTVPAHDGIWFRADNPEWNGSPGEWADLGEAQEEQLIAHLRKIHRIKQENGQVELNTAGIQTFKEMTWERCAEKIAGGLYL